MINAADWKTVKRKTLGRNVTRFLEENDIKISSVYVSGAFGSLYIDVARGEWDSEYEIYGEGDVFTIRISDHEQTSSNHAQPDLNIVSEFTDAMRAEILDWVADV